ncbi:hypothetical protein HYH03_006208 [Edaphochlamys debaryana]|uniref:Glycosyl transferase CAP10 domain-containing protein n=1 Tax=Edaphochlamys debaryana TaxID=47281 RepID=A0A835Y6G1_9CHLO|nr:hypothetical protein HYH03_006208 [Edaphochlamys debaryana]|eukprot:KAG2495608.1 hypothetical protein HYH03_006208 [Edaphochlamys debaryana]
MVWRDRVACGGKLEMGPFLEWAKYVTTTTGTKKIVIIKDGKIGFPVEGQETIWNETCPGPCHGLLLAHMKGGHEDVLVPLLAGMQLQGWGLHSYPWEKKIDKAIFRGSGFCHAKRFSYTNGACSRTYLAARVANNPEWREHIDAGLLNPGRFKSLQFNGSFPVSVEDSAHFRFTLNLDGITASSRLSKLLALNSVVLKQASPHVEWYYRSLLPNVHYLPFWDHGRDDILCVLEQRKRHPDKILKKIAQNGQAFAYHYLRPAARRQYFIEALKEYRELFGSDMDDYITQHVRA